ncbi:ferrous-iron efflux pump FieF [Candidatus Magnetomoraceae bacterium gMMP-15]
MNADKQIKMRVIAISTSFFVGALLMAVKFYAYSLTNSSAILSDALESIINVIASAFALVSILFASQPPDENHPYGHGKIEYFSAGFEGALIILAALAIFKTGILHIFHPVKLPCLKSGLLILFGASLVNLILGIGLIRIGKNTRSITLIADGKHLLTDVYTSAGVLLGLVLVYLTGWNWFDGTIACIVGLNILFSGAKLVRQSFAGLMNESDPELLDEISELLTKYRKDILIDIHQLRAWTSGSLIHIDFHLTLPRDCSLENAHGESKKLEYFINKNFKGDTSILIHLDPCLDTDCPSCARYYCNLRMEESKNQIIWTRETLIKQGKI